jgi:hypothetical protein
MWLGEEVMKKVVVGLVRRREEVQWLFSEIGGWVDGLGEKR